MSQWVAFPKNLRYFPIFIEENPIKKGEDNFFVLLQAVLESYTKHESEIIQVFGFSFWVFFCFIKSFQVEHFGELVGWRLSDSFELVLKSDIDDLTKLIHHFAKNDVDINHELKLLKIESKFF